MRHVADSPFWSRKTQVRGPPQLRGPVAALRVSVSFSLARSLSWRDPRPYAEERAFLWPRKAPARGPVAAPGVSGRFFSFSLSSLSISQYRSVSLYSFFRSREARPECARVDGARPECARVDGGQVISTAARATAAGQLCVAQAILQVLSSTARATAITRLFLLSFSFFLSFFFSSLPLSPRVSVRFSLSLYLSHSRSILFLSR